MTNKTIQHRRGTAAEHASFTGAEGEFTYDTTDKRIVAHDGTTAGGIPLAKESEAGIVATVAASAKTTPVDADLIGIADSADSDSLKKLTFANLATWMGTKLGAVYVALSGKTTPVDADVLPIGDSEASNATKKLTWANLKATLKTYLDTLYQPVDATLTSLAAVAGVAGDILYASGTDTWARLAKGTNGHVLTLSGGLPAWSAPASAAGTARNRIVNPAMQISSINGNTAGTSSGYAPADNWLKYHVSSAGTLTAQRVQSVTPKGAKDRIRLTITAADASLAAGEYLTLTQNIAGQEIADFQYGTANAKQVLLRFLFKGPQGVYAVALHNAAQNRSYVATFTIGAGEANTDTIQQFTIPGDTTGTWTTTSSTGLTLDIVLACGSTFQGTTGWQAGQILGTSGVSNGMATLNDVFEIGEVGMYLDVSATGSFPTWELPSYTVDNRFVLGDGPHVILEDQKSSGTDGGTFSSGANRTRTLNTKVYDPLGLCTLSSNQFTLPAGTYYICWSAPAFIVNGHQTLLYNATDASEVARGEAMQSSSSSGYAVTRSGGSYVVAITGSKAFEIRHRCATTSATTEGLGRAASFGTEVYTRVEITKVA